MQILQRIESIRGREHSATVELIEALVECHHTRAHVDAGYRSIFQLLVERLHYSRAAASRRFAAMRCALHGPFVIDMLREHRTCLTALARVAAVLDDVDDAGSLLRSIDGFTPDEVDAVVAAMRPIPRPVERVRVVAVESAVPASDVGTLWGSSAEEPVSDPSRGTNSTPECPVPMSEPTPIDENRASATRTAPESEPRVALSFSLTRDAHASLERVRTRLSRSRPRPLTLEETINALVREHELREERRRARKNTRRVRANGGSTRHVPNATRDLVFGRDGHRCAYVAPDGTRCTATYDLQVDHVHPFALGGGHEPENLRLLCGAHNRRRAEQTFGRRSHG